jgi:hypothetical protein
MDLETKLLRQILEAMDRYERAKRAEAARRCRLMEKLLKCTDYQSIIKSTDE